VGVLRADERGVNCVAPHPDGRHVATAGLADRTVRAWDLETGREVVSFVGHTAEVRWLAFSPDGWILATAAADGTVRLWNVEDGREWVCLRGHEGKVWSVSFSPDGRLLVSGGEDRTVRIWDLQRVQERACLRGHEWTVTAVAFSPDGRRILSGSFDRTLREWDAEAVPLAAPVQAERTGPIHQVSFSADGRRLTVTADVPRIYDPETGLEPGRAADLPPVTAEPPSPWTARVEAQETIVTDRATGSAVAFFPATPEALQQHPSLPLWAGADGCHLYLFRLEGTGQNQSSSSSAAGAGSTATTTGNGGGTEAGR
jgi:WD40 repeat protein